ncbi:MAG: glycosyltransferase family 39 protein [Phototrophicaceae bacterium]
MKRLHLGLMSLATFILVFASLVFVAYSYNLITFPYDYDQGEGFELVDTILFSEFRYPYQNTDQYPYYSSNYPPLYHVIAAPFVWIFGEAYWYGRLLSAISTVIAALAIMFAVNRETSHRWIAVLSGLAFLSSNTVYHIAPLFRQHIMMVMFETLAIVLLAHAIPKKQNRLILTGLLLLIIAGYTKQLAAITALATIAWMLLRNPIRGIKYTLGFTLVGGLIFAWLTVDTNGEWWRQTIVANVNEFNPFQTFGLTLLWLRLHVLLIIPAILMVLYDLYFNRLSLYSVWFVMATILGAFGSGTWGAGDSYFATSIAAMCILSGIFLGRTLQNGWSLQSNNRYIGLLAPIKASKTILMPVMLILIPSLYIGYGIMTFKMPTEGAVFGEIASVFNIQPNVFDRHYDSASYDVLGYANIGHFVTKTDIENGDYIVELIRQTDAPVMSEEAGFSIAAGRDVITNPTQLRNLWLNGLWNGDELLAEIENQSFGMIIFRAQFYPVPVLEVIGQTYTIEETVTLNGFEYLILRPLE